MILTTRDSCAPRMRHAPQIGSLLFAISYDVLIISYHVNLYVPGTGSIYLSLIHI